MKEKIVEYRLKVGANRLNEIIQFEIKRKTFNKQKNTFGEYSGNDGLNISNRSSILYVEPYLGPFVQLNLKIVNINSKGTESKLILKRVNGATFNVHSWFSLFFITLTLIIAIYQIWTKGFKENLNFLVMPIFGFFYYVLIELIGGITFQNMIKRIEKIMTRERIKYERV